jgi:hypothetical protein
MLGLTRPQFAYRLKRLHEDEQSRSQIGQVTPADRPVEEQS